MDQKSTQPSLLETGMLAAATGITIGIADSALWPLSLLLTAVGAATAVYAVRSGSKFDLLWKNLGFVRGHAGPKLVDRQEGPTRRCYRFQVPAGLGREDFEKNRSAIEQFLGEEIRIRREGTLICIRTADEDERWPRVGHGVKKGEG